ncbi:MAG: hypothetical protein D8M59_15740 [Planctomycetes bacterium]|nr:hypothetical protein [Planctomycetota bacterium]
MRNLPGLGTAPLMRRFLHNLIRLRGKPSADRQLTLFAEQTDRVLEEPTAPPSPPPRPASSAVTKQPTTAQQRYDALVVEMKDRYGLRVRKWRSNTTGCAWAVTYTDGSRSRLIEAPYPKGPVSAAVFLHEVGHHAIGLGAVRPRCLEEYRAWQWSLLQMEAHGIDVTSRLKKRVVESLHYAVSKAARRGLKRLPVELAGFVDRHAIGTPGHIDALIDGLMSNARTVPSLVG